MGNLLLFAELHWNKSARSLGAHVRWRVVWPLASCGDVCITSREGAGGSVDGRIRPVLKSRKEEARRRQADDDAMPSSGESFCAT